MAARPPGSRRVFTRHRDNLDNLLRRKGGRRTRAWVIGQGCHDHGGERFVTAPIDFNLLQLGGEGEPPLAPIRMKLSVHGLYEDAGFPLVLQTLAQ
jgi:hypothetical protein